MVWTDQSQTVSRFLLAWGLLAVRSNMGKVHGLNWPIAECDKLIDLKFEHGGKFFLGSGMDHRGLHVWTYYNTVSFSFWSEIFNTNIPQIEIKEACLATVASFILTGDQGLIKGYCARSALRGIRSTTSRSGRCGMLNPTSHHSVWSDRYSFI